MGRYIYIYKFLNYYYYYYNEFQLSTHKINGTFEMFQDVPNVPKTIKLNA